MIYWTGRVLIVLLQALPLTWAAQLGRAGGALAYWLNVRHRRLARRNLTMVFGHETSAREIRALARLNFRRIGENYACAVKTAVMTKEQLAPHVEFPVPDALRVHLTATASRSVVIAIGHFGNFELYAGYGQFVPPIQGATTYRALYRPAVNRLLQELRNRCGCLYFERRTGGAALKATMSEHPLQLGLLADQHLGKHGVSLPFLGRECNHTTAPAVFAQHYNCVLISGICYRVGLARWRIEPGREIPTRENGEARTIEAMTADVVRVLETAVRCDPANWFWVHNCWKTARKKAAGNSPSVRPASAANARSSP